MIGYSGSGYKGIQIMPTERTIEGDLFSAFVKAGAVSKANADDPKKNSLVRCARTDKGVHAAGNVISLKMIIEDEDIVQKINSHLSPQIRVWGIERTTGSFSCYQACDSRWYEYLIPTHCFLPPHPSSFLGKKIVELAEEVGDLEGLKERQAEVADFWADTDKDYIQPILHSLDEKTRALVQEALFQSESDPETSEQVNETVTAVEAAADISLPTKIVEGEGREAKQEANHEKTEEAAIIIQAPESSSTNNAEDEPQPADQNPPTLEPSTKRGPIADAIKSLKAALITAKRAYRIPRSRLTRVRDVLEGYVGTHNFHNYTIRKTFRDPSAKRHIKSFQVASSPIIKGDTEWLSLKVHGQSFMMHQIRKMVGMAALVVRCGCPTERVRQTFGADGVSIPKAPGLGLLLERPVFDSYNNAVANKFDKPTVGFERYEKEMEEFKQREIYDRIWREENKDNIFNAFFAHIDSYRENSFLFVTSKGLKATEGAERVMPAEKSKGAGGKKGGKMDFDSEDEGSGGEG